MRASRVLAVRIARRAGTTPPSQRLIVSLTFQEFAQLMNNKAPAAEPNDGKAPTGLFGSDANPVTVKMVGRRGEMIVNLLFLGATMLVVLFIAWPYLGGRSGITPESVGDVTFDDVCGCEEAKAEVMEIVDFLQHPDKYEKVQARLPKGVLLYGAPGTGSLPPDVQGCGRVGVCASYYYGWW